MRPGRIHGRTYCKGCARAGLEERQCNGMPGREMVQQIHNDVKEPTNHLKKSCIITKRVWAQAIWFVRGLLCPRNCASEKRRLGRCLTQMNQGTDLVTSLGLKRWKLRENVLTGSSEVSRQVNK